MVDVLYHETFEALTNDLKKVREKLDSIHVEEYHLASKLIRLQVMEVLCHMPELDFDDVTIGDWSCDESPIEVCAYNDAEDPLHDECLFCGDPEERK
jgi:hypothetical protein